ncbi:MAG: 4-(cytidine 5'-diphospho)-2-C-methyl-D-erythritol kinase [Bacteroidetes bacterium RIFCSPLOWO2_12_FULL_31_6]|nr:MAG: 4-(cytidine 5'-diphospho)-2-C-methyl-D-erythritol kinase [Bacteroidetes bacterium RIFCSPLOWO2_12_FULL_31_6]
MLCFPNAKINIGLNIIEKRADCFHNLETVFYPIKLQDTLEIIKLSQNKETVFNSYGTPIPGNGSNLCIKAYELLKQDFNLCSVDIGLLKNIPIGAGLGGGSSDAAFTLKLLNELFELKLSIELLEKYARLLGSDCAFFIQNKAVFAFGKGEQFEEITLSLSNYFIVLVNPVIHIGTAEAYANTKPIKPKVSLKELILLPITEWKNNIKNDFEDSIFPNYPAIAEIKNKLYEMGALYSSMSGSGSSVYGIFSSIPELKNVFTDYFVWTGKITTDIGK